MTALAFFGFVFEVADVGGALFLVAGLCHGTPPI
jgi:hypothetical protein